MSDQEKGEAGAGGFNGQGATQFGGEVASPAIDDDTADEVEEAPRADDDVDDDDGEFSPTAPEEEEDNSSSSQRVAGSSSGTGLTSAGGRRRRWQSIGLDDYEPDYYNDYEFENDLLALGAAPSSSANVNVNANNNSNFGSSANPSGNNNNDVGGGGSATSSGISYWRRWEDAADLASRHQLEMKKQRIDFDFLDAPAEEESQLVENKQLDEAEDEDDPLHFLSQLDQSQVDFDQTTANNNSSSTLNNSSNNNLLKQKMPLSKLPVTGLRQSPIDINPTSSVLNRQKRSLDESSGIPPLTIDYSILTGASGLNLENTGHGWKLNIPDELAARCPISGGPLGNDQYRLLQIHSHWGCDSSCGSEHTLNGKAFPCEIHLVHWNATKYSNPSEAMECTNDGLAVLGVFVQISGEPAEPLNVIIKSLPDIPFKGDKVPVNAPELDLNALVPTREAPKYWNYEGSLTTPPFSESVIWIVLEQALDAQEEQIAQFRTMNKNDCNCDEVVALKENYRELQAINNRNIAYFD